MAQEIINIGTLPNDGEGDPLRVAFAKINNNFSSLFSTSTTTSEAYTTSTAANQIIWEIPVTEFTQGKFQIQSINTTNNDSQNITISAQILNDQYGVKCTGYGTTFNGNAIGTFDMVVASSNVRILTTPLTANFVQYFIASTVTYFVDEPGLLMQLDGYSDTNMGTEDDLDITTE